MKDNQKTRSAGYSVIELMMVVGVIGFLAVGVARFTKSIETTRAESSARSYSNDMNRQLVGLMERDFRYQTAFEVSANNLRLDITRRQQYDADDSNAVYQVTFQTECVAPPAAMAGFISEVYNSGNRTQLVANENPCLQRLACPAGSYPQVRISTPSSTGNQRVPTYSPNIFPDLLSSVSTQNSVRQGTVGTAACFFNTGNRIRIVTQSVFLGGRVHDQESIRVTSDEALVSTSNIAGVDLLPNEN